MSSVTTKSKPFAALCALLLSAAAAGQTTQIPAKGLCNTGLTKASPLPAGCATSSPVTPMNPETGGTSVDGNWSLATPYPSAASNQPDPNPCLLSTFGPAWVDAPWSTWLNPDDGRSQYIMPLAVEEVGGWYVYRTAFPIPPSATNYVLTVAGQVLVDDDVLAIVLENPAGYAPSCRTVSAQTSVGSAAWTAWHSFNFSALVVPGTYAYLYFIDYNLGGNVPNATGLRVEFTEAYFTPE
ncbi:MAG: hypothetical protein ABSH24_24180 [Bryobacteraceae bacterium]|jgi:hypothetical protein